MIDLFKIIGALGLIAIISGVLIKPKNREVRDILYIFGGLFLTVYSIYIKDIIFIILQIIFMIVASYDLIRLKSKH
ncbi:MAG: hypothetical protein Q8P81_00715 [Nanoarchaeota archaeon]|nr:hypothetical protein [Nanoarchaeota archaeon]